VLQSVFVHILLIIGQERHAVVPGGVIEAEVGPQWANRRLVEQRLRPSIVACRHMDQAHELHDTDDAQV
jgi:hypothetical protein